MPKSKSEMMKALREQRAAQGLKEVRGIWVKPEFHERIKNYAEKLTKTPNKP